MEEASDVNYGQALLFQNPSTTHPSAEHDLGKERNFGGILPTYHGVGVRAVVEAVVEDGPAQVDHGGPQAHQDPPPGLAPDQAVGGGHKHRRHRGQNERSGAEERVVDAGW